MRKESKFNVTIFSNLLSILVSIFISFVITKYFVEYIGKEAYSYYPIANNFSTYFSLFFVAINISSSRYIVIKYLNNEIKEAQSYYTTIFVSCVILSLFVFSLEMLFYFNLSGILNIPNNLLRDVKTLFLLIFLSSICHGIVASFNAIYYVKNRMDLYGISVIAENIVKGILMLVLYISKSIGLISLGYIILISTIIRYLFSINFSSKYMKEIKFDLNTFSIIKLKSILKTGIWAIVSNSGNIIILNSELILSNALIGIESSSELSLIQPLMTLCLLLGNTITVMLEPLMIESIATNKYDEIKKIRISLMCLLYIPIVLVITLNKHLYAIWLPKENNVVLYNLTFLMCLQILFSFINYMSFSAITTLLREKIKGIGFIVSTVLYVCLIILLNKKLALDNYHIIFAGIISYVLYFVIFIPLCAKKLLKETNKKVNLIYLKDYFCVLVTMLINVLVAKIIPLNNILLFMIMCLVCACVDYVIVLHAYKIKPSEMIKSVK